MKTDKFTPRILMFLMISFLFVIGGCASKSFVREQIELLKIENQKIAAELASLQSGTRRDIVIIQKDIEMNREQLSEIKNQTVSQKDRVENELSALKDALERADQKWGKRADRRMLYQITISDDSVSFPTNRSDLSRDAKEALDVFAGYLVAENRDVFIEIQGHTDNVGSEKHNLELGKKRADAVKSYLHTKHGVPLHRMSVFSYGESKPVADNRSEAGRSKNRRVVLMVME